MSFNVFQGVSMRFKGFQGVLKAPQKGLLNTQGVSEEFNGVSGEFRVASGDYQRYQMKFPGVF